MLALVGAVCGCSLLAMTSYSNEQKRDLTHMSAVRHLRALVNRYSRVAVSFDVQFHGPSAGAPPDERAELRGIERAIQEHLKALAHGGEIETDARQRDRITPLAYERPSLALAVAAARIAGLTESAELGENERDGEVLSLIRRSDAASAAIDDLANVLQTASSANLDSHRQLEFGALYINAALLLALGLWGNRNILRPLLSARRELLESSLRLAAVVNGVTECVVTVDEAFQIQGANQATEDTFGFTREELLTQSLALLVPSGLPTLTDSRQRHIRRQQLLGQRFDGSLFPLELALQELRLENKRLFVATMRDITERVDHETDLRRHHEELQSMVDDQTLDLRREAATIGLLLNVASMANSAKTLEEALWCGLELTCNYLGWPLGCARLIREKHTQKDSAIWYGYPDSMATSFGDGPARLAACVIEGGEAVVAPNRGDCEAFGLRPGVGAALAFPVMTDSELIAIIEVYSDTPRDVEGSLVPLLHLVGKQIGLVAERERREQKLRAAVDAAETANHHKTEFLSNMSHEFRTPMHAIINYTNLSLKGLESPDLSKVRRYLSNVQTSGKRLLDLLNDVLDLSKMEAGRLSYEWAHARFDEVVDAALAEVEPLLNAKSIRVDRISEAGDAYFDRARMIQVMLNLLSNAIKFSSEGSSIGIRLTEAQVAEQSFLMVRVRDTGVGIPSEELEAVFDKFQQSKRTKDGSGGTGLGLAICRQSLSAHGGRIWAEAAPGAGTELVLIFPRERELLGPPSRARGAA